MALPLDPSRMATRSKSSQRWLKEHFSDPYVKKAQAEGLRSRAAYKLEELVARDRLLKPGMTVVDLGAAPGGWSQWVRAELDRMAKGTDEAARVIALDILEMAGLAGVDFLHGDFREDAVLSQLEAALNGKPVDLVLSDMAPNKSGVDAVDQPRAMHLAELAMDFADRHLKPGGAFLIKLYLERPDYTFYLRGADGSHALVNERTLDRSFVIAPEALVEDWPVVDAKAMSPSDLEALFALKPEVIVLGTGPTQRFPSAAVMHACLSRSIGFEVMDNAAAARTYSVLAGEGRRVVAGFIFP